MKVLGLVSSQTDPASRARIIQYSPYLENNGINLYTKIFHPLRDADPWQWTLITKKITNINPWRVTNAVKGLGRLPLLFSQYHYDLIWQNRLILPHHFYLESALKKLVVFDFDDAIWMNEGALFVKKKIGKSALVFAGNEFLASYARKFNSNVKLVPSTVDTSVLKPMNNNIPFTIGWIGSVSNFVNLEMIKDPIIAFLKRNADSRLMIVSSEMPQSFNFDNKKIIFKKWSAADENNDINEFSVGLMPLINNEWNLGKCSYKMLQYMACGKPVVVSPVGNNNTILNHSIIGIGARAGAEWLDALTVLKEDQEFYLECSKNAREVACKNYDTSVWAEEISKAFKTLI